MGIVSIAAKREVAQPNWENVHAVVSSQIRADGFHEWPFVPSFPIDVRYFEFDKHRFTRKTRHDYYELLFVHSGRAVYEVANKEYAIAPGELIVLNGGFFHRLAQIVSPPFRAIVLYFLPGILRNFDRSGEYVQYLAPFLLQNGQFPHLISSKEEIAQEVLQLISRIYSALPANGDRERLAVRTALKLILVLLLNHYSDHLSVADDFDRWNRTLNRIRPLFEYIEAHYRSPIPLGQASQLVGMSKPHFMRSFKRLTGQSFDTYLHHFRIAKAQALLASTDLSISAIGEEVGFSDQSYFGLVFRRLVQLSPRDFRKSIAES